MRSNVNKQRLGASRDPISNFMFGAASASVLMLLVAVSLYIHAHETRAWLAKIRLQAADRVSRVPVSDSVKMKTAGCPIGSPVLTGFDSAGKAVCRSLGVGMCGDGQYISSIDPFTLQVRCADAGGEISCPANSYISEFMWLGETRTSFSCGQRLDPFVAWKFAPSLSAKGND